MNSHDTIDSIFDFLQNKTINSVDADQFNSKDYLVILLSDGSRVYISSSDSLYIALEKHIIN